MRDGLQGLFSCLNRGDFYAKETEASLRLAGLP